jgi:HEAT repeat protein
VRSAAATALGKFDDARVVDPLIQSLGDEEERVRKNAAKSLEKRNDIEALQKAGQHQNATIRKEAALILARMGGEAAAAPLVAGLTDGDASVRVAAAKSLGKRKDFSGVEDLILALGDNDAGVRVAAAKALGEIGDARVIDPLITHLIDEDDEVRANILNAIDALDLVYYEKVENMDTLVRALSHEDMLVRAKAAFILSQIDGHKAHQVMNHLIVALKDTYVYVRSSSCNALGKIGDTQAVEPLISCLQDQEPFVRAVAADALGKIGDVRAMFPLMETLTDSDTYVRMNSAHALGQVGDKRAIGALKRARWDSKGLVRDWAKSAIKKIKARH